MITGNSPNWGMSDIKISVEKCPLDCTQCEDHTYSSCRLWKRQYDAFTSVTLQDFDFIIDGWILNGLRPGIYQCSGMFLLHAGFPFIGEIMG